MFRDTGEGHLPRLKAFRFQIFLESPKSQRNGRQFPMNSHLFCSHTFYMNLQLHEDIQEQQRERQANQQLIDELNSQIQQSDEKNDKVLV